MVQVRNLLYRRPELYERVYPEPDEATPRLCLRLFERFLGRLPSSILDLGCGTGRDLAALARHAPDCVGVDAEPAMVRYARATRPEVRFEVGDMRSVRLGRTFDAVLCLGSALMYAHTNEDVELSLSTFACHCHDGSLLVLDLRNAVGFLPGGCTFQEHVESAVALDGQQASVVTTHSFDRRTQRMVRRRLWRISGQEPVEDYCEYRLFFPAELAHLLGEHGFEALAMYDNMEMRDTALTGARLYVAARYAVQAQRPA